MARPLLYVFAKEPEAGRVKTRLCPPLTHSLAARLCEAFLADTLARVCAGADWEVALATEPGEGGPVLQRLSARFGLARTPQGKGDLGTRMERVMRSGHERGRQVALMGGDTPDLPVAYVGMAFDALRRERVVLGPSRDGGYYLIGAGEPVRALFDIDAGWSGPHVLSATMRRLESEAITPFHLPGWEDIDDAASLARLALRVREGFSEAEHTAAVLAELEQQGVAF